MITAPLRTVVALASCAAFASQVVAQASFTVLPGPPDSNGERPFAVSSNGGYVAGSYRIDNSQYDTACNWDPSNGLRTLLPGNAFAISDDGGTTAVRASNGRMLAVYRDGFEFIEPSGGGVRFGYPHDVTPDGATIVGYFENADRDDEPFIWTHETGLIGLGLTPGARRGFAVSITPDGSAIAGWMDEDFGIAFVWTEETGYRMLEEYEQGPRLSEGFDLSDDGAVVVGRMGSDPGFWSRDGHAVPIPFFGGMRDGYALACSGDGGVIVGEMNSGTDRRAFIWDEANGTRELREALQSEYGLDLAGIELERASDISRSGNVIVGIGHYEGQAADFAWRFVVPTPPTAGLGLVLVLSAARRRRG